MSKRKPKYVTQQDFIEALAWLSGRMAKLENMSERLENCEHEPFVVSGCFRCADEENARLRTALAKAEAEAERQRKLAGATADENVKLRQGTAPPTSPKTRTTHE